MSNQHGLYVASIGEEVEGPGTRFSPAYPTPWLTIL